jgi:probable rRNA maturation factor
LAISQTTAEVIFSYKKFATLKRWLNQVIEQEGFKTGDIAIVFTSDHYLLELNRKFLQHDYYTDVITFNYSTDKYVSGDILISIERVKENAVTFNSGMKDELDRVILHGILHLTGYNDDNKLNVSIMRNREAYHLGQR